MCFIYKVATLALARYTSYFCLQTSYPLSGKIYSHIPLTFILHRKISTITKPPLRFCWQNSFKTCIYEILLWIFIINKVVAVVAKICFN